MSTIVNNKGKNAVLISKDIMQNYWRNIIFIIYSGICKQLNEIRENENWKTAKEYNFNEEW